MSEFWEKAVLTAAALSIIIVPIYVALMATGHMGAGILLGLVWMAFSFIALIGFIWRGL